MSLAVIIKKNTTNRQIKNDAELEADIRIAAIERGDPHDNRNWSRYYITTRLGFQKQAYKAKLRKLKKTIRKILKHSDQSKKCLDSLALLGDAEAASPMLKLLLVTGFIIAAS